MDQLFSSNVISRNVLGFCAAGRMPEADPDNPVGYISMGVDFEKDFNQRDSHSVTNWVKLLRERRVLCAYGARLLYIFVDKRRITVRLPERSAGISIYFDTGSDLTYLHKTVYDQVVKALDTYASNRGYVRKVDNDSIEESARRLCWEPPSKKRKIGGKSQDLKASPYDDFGPLKFGFEGMPVHAETSPLQYLIIKPENYMIWDEDEIKLCVNILEDTSRQKVSNLGGKRPHFCFVQIL